MTLAQAHLDDPDVSAMIATLGPVRQAHWRAPRSPYRPAVFSATEGHVTAWALVSSRPHTAAHKVADLVVSRESNLSGPADLDSAETRTAVRRVLEDVIAAHPDDASTRIEAHPWLADLIGQHHDVLRDLGFVVSRPPLPSIPSTFQDITGWVRLAAPLRPARDEIPPFVGQTTDFTCGAVSLITALHRPRRLILADPLNASSNRRDELRWWRKATNMPAVDPLTLALVEAEALSGSGRMPIVYLTESKPILLEEYEGVEREQRAVLQEISRTEAIAAGIEISSQWPGASGLANLIEDGYTVQLLIDETPMHGEQVPHWITVFAVTSTATGAPVVVVQDPWVDAEHGETWVDADQLPIGLDDIELMSQFGKPAYRSAIAIPATGHGKEKI